MASYVETPTRSDTAAGSIAQHLRVKTPGSVAAAGASDVSIGTMELPCLAAGPCTVRLRTAQGTRKMVAVDAITKGNTVYAAASGKISATGTVREGIAMETSTADNDVIEVMDAVHVDLVASGGITLPTVTFNGATTVNKLAMPDDLADALSVVEGANKYLTFVTTNAGEKIQANKPVEITSAGAAALAVGRLGSTTPAFQVDASTGTSITGVKVKSAAASGGVAISAIGETNVNMTIDAAGSGTITIGGTSTGAITLTRAVTLGVSAGGAGSTFVPLIPIAAQQALSGAGAINITTYYTAVTSTGTDALTLVDGAVKGQLKKIQLIVDGGDATLTPENLDGGATITFTDVGDYAILCWDGTNWVAIELGNDVDGATAPALV